MRQYLEPIDIINSIKLLLKHPFYSDKLILIVEGASDIRFFRSLFDQEHIKIESIDGKKNLIYAMGELVGSHKGKVISICDADFDHIENLENERNQFDIYLTDYHDSEVMMLKSDSLFSFIDEYSQNEYLLSLKSQLLSNAFDASKVLGVLRYINLKFNMKLSFKKLNFSQFIKVNLLEIELNLETLIDVLISRSPNFSHSKEDLYNYFHVYLKNNYKNEQINCGHDLTNIIACIFRQREISLEPNMDTKKIETALRLAYQKDYFKNTSLYRNTKAIFSSEKEKTISA
ncbi:DUF4435 domain-containing protein [Acinetobacter sp. Z1]|uniref:DUF4435 domain-containing protein n=1 Tax=Acinetobacter sp. Z1 TaxID=2953738 RepID=UPI0020C95D6A|nr:DUF4435 domain-containing protein [Acinetobacter sp. Z1]UTO19669.1 DUF4435 domain-containing protein [Acinetobacter sp. Z1]